MMIIGILPTLTERPAQRRGAERQPALHAAQRADLRGPRRGPADRRSTASSGCRSYADTIAPEAACTSVQLHQLVDPAAFAAHWNAAQAIAGIQLAVGANSPFFFGRELWRETRIALFEQATDTRPEELKAQGVRPRVWFGERWITSIFDLFEENVRYFPSLLPVSRTRTRSRCSSAATRRGCRSCGCTTARSTAGTARSTTSCAAARTCAWRTACCRPARRSSTRSPTPPSTTGSCACWSTTTGRSGRRCRSRPPRRTSTRARATASTRASTGRASARCRRPSSCCAGCCRWPTRASTAGASTPPTRDRLLGIIERRCVERRNGASWQAATFHRLYERLDRADALREMTVRYREHMHSNEPVHTWPLD